MNLEWTQLYLIMDVKKKLNILKNEKGQGLIEFFLFLPFILMMYSICLSLASSINASINQQKVARGYFYYKMSNNTMIPGPRRDGRTPEANWDTYSMHVNIWAESQLNGSDKVKATCFKFEVPLGESSGDSCEQGYSGRTTQYIRVATAYGICGNTYKNNGGNFVPVLTNGLNHLDVIGTPGCTIQ